jgi:hypothetical protein
MCCLLVRELRPRTECHRTEGSHAPRKLRDVKGVWKMERCRTAPHVFVPKESIKRLSVDKGTYAPQFLKQRGWDGEGVYVTLCAAILHPGGALTRRTEGIDIFNS